MTNTILLKSRPEGKPTVSNFEFVTDNSELEINDGEILLRNSLCFCRPLFKR